MRLLVGFTGPGLRFGVGGRADVRSQATETRSLRADIRPAHPVTHPVTPVPSAAGRASAKNLAVCAGLLGHAGGAAREVRRVGVAGEFSKRAILSHPGEHS